MPASRQPHRKPKPTPAATTTRKSARKSVHPAATRRAGTRAALIAGIVLALLFGAYAAAAALSGRTIPHGTSVAGVDVGSKSRAEAAAALRAGLDKRASKPVELTAAQGERTARTQLKPADAGLAPDIDGTVDALLGFTLDPRIVVPRLLGGSERPVDIAADDHALTTASDAAAKKLSAAPTDAALTVTGSTTHVKKAATGIEADGAAVRSALRTGWLREDSLRVASEAADPQVSTADAQEAQRSLAEPALSKPLVLTVRGSGQESRVTVRPAQLAAALSFPAKDGALTRSIDAKRLHAAIAKKDSTLGTAARDASFRMSGGAPVVVPARSGTTVEPKALVAGVEHAVGAANRTAAVTRTVQEPEFTTADAKKADVSQVASEFHTPYNSEPARDANLRTAARKVTGTVVMPGKRFSLNDTLGERTAANGYRKAGVISGGEMKEDYGGGVSQVSTTLFNAAFFAGFELNEHQAHSRYISRYPEGREATLDWRSIDMAFTNTTKSPVVLAMDVSGGRVTAQVFGTRAYDVKAESSGRFNRTSPGTKQGSGSTCRPQSPKGGWSITIKRTMTEKATGRTTRDQFTTVYAPVTGITCR